MHNDLTIASGTELVDMGVWQDGRSVNVLQALMALHEKRAFSADASLQPSKFLSPKNALVMGRPADAALGLAHYMRVHQDTLRAMMVEGCAAIEREFNEHGTETDREWFEYVYRRKATPKKMGEQVRDEGRNGETIDDFVRHPSSQKARLTKAHVLALRLYSTPCYQSLNEPLRRQPNRRSNEPMAPHPFAATVAFLDEGIRQLRANQAPASGKSDASGKSAKFASSQVGSALATGQVLWRGMRAIDMTEEFLTRGGTELAPMSTTPDLSVAVYYGLSASTLLFRLTSTDFMDRGASIAYLSAFPNEDEMLYPPLTYLRPLGKPRVEKVGGVEFTIVAAKPSF